MPFYNTIQADLTVAFQYEAQSISDENMVLEVMRKVKRAAWFEVVGFLPSMNEVSLKRALTDLKSKGILAKDTDKANMVMGPSGKRCHQYFLIK